MRSVRVVGTRLKVSRWSIGTATLHHVFSRRERQRILGAAAEAGFTHFDTSPLYGGGLAEVDLGRFLRGRRERFTVATKVGLYPAGGYTHGAAHLWLQRAVRRATGRRTVERVDWQIDMAERSLDASLKRLNTDHVDILFLHEPDPALIDADEFLRWLEREHQRGRIRAWGLAGSKVARAAWVANRHPLARVVQVKDSLTDHEADALLELGRPLQFAYGYLSSLMRQRPPPSITTTVLREILQRVPNGSIIVSTRRVGHLADFAKAAEAEACA